MTNGAPFFVVGFIIGAIFSAIAILALLEYIDKNIKK